MRDIPSPRNLAFPLILICALFYTQWSRSANKVPLWRFQGLALGTSYTVQVIHPEEIDQLVISQVLDDVNERMSTYVEGSELNRLSAHPDVSPFPVSKELYEVLSAAKEVTAQSQGSFDVTVAPLVEAWGFGPSGRRPTPSAEELGALRTQYGDKGWRLEDAQVVKTNTQVRFDLSAIAKGYAVDQIARALEAKQIQRYWVEVGGEVRVKGLNAEGRAWRVGVERPAQEGSRRIHKIISLRDTTIATSGDYRNRYLDDNGTLRSHTIDPRTGEPVNHLLASVSVIHPINMYADAWATALNVLGLEQGLKLANQHNIAAFFISREGVTVGQLDPDQPDVRYLSHFSEAMKEYLSAE